MTLAVGAPWEIHRVQSDDNRVTDYYTKGGDIGVYSSLLALIPDYNVGFSIFTADESAADVAATLSEMLANTFGTALEAAAKTQAVSKFAGSYTASDGPNSSIVISTSDTFGLAVESWTSEGNDMFTNIELTQGITSMSLQFLARLVPVNTNSGDANSFPFRAVLGFEGSPPSNVFNLNCATWTTVDALNYGGVPLDLFVFQVDGDGVMTGLSLPGFANYAWKGRLMSISSNIHSEHALNPSIYVRHIEKGSMSCNIFIRMHACGLWFIHCSKLPLRTPPKRIRRLHGPLANIKFFSSQYSDLKLYNYLSFNIDSHSQLHLSSQTPALPP
jgi:hypothetical protein